MDTRWDREAGQVLTDARSVVSRLAALLLKAAEHRCGPAPTPLLHSVGDAAALIGVTERAVWQLIADGRLRAVELGRRRLIRADDLAAFVDSLPTHKPTTEGT